MNASDFQLLLAKFTESFAESSPSHLEQLLAELHSLPSESQFMELLSVEIQQRQNRNLSIDQNEFVQRFPQFESCIRQWFSESVGAPIPTSPSLITTVVPLDRYNERDRFQSDLVNPRSGRFGKAFRWFRKLFNRLIPSASVSQLDLSFPYEIRKRIGAGGMGEVFEAFDTRLQRVVAIKFLQQTLLHSGLARIRFLREARAIAALNHENVISVYHIGEYNGRPYFVMPLLVGQTLQDTLSSGPLGAEDIIAIGLQIARGLAVAHARGIVHRDLKPANIWISGLDASQNRTVTILDFGLASTPNVDLVVTDSNQILGTLAFMSPEVVRGEPAGPRSDLFGLGLVLYTAATGFNPFLRSNPAATLLAIQTLKVTTSSQLNSSIPGELSGLIDSLLSNSPDHRPRTAQYVAERLEVIGSHQAAVQRINSLVDLSEEKLLTRVDEAIRGGGAMPDYAPTTLVIFGESQEGSEDDGKLDDGGDGRATRVDLIQWSLVVNNRSPFLIGRDPKADISLERTGRLSRNHAMIYWYDGVFILKDLQSTNGTWVGKNRCGVHVLNDGAKFECGGVQFVFCYEAWFIVLSGARINERIYVGRSYSMTFGNTGESDVVFDDDHLMAPVHFRIRYVNGRYLMTDIAQTSQGRLVVDDHVDRRSATSSQEVELVDNMVICCGTTQMRFHLYRPAVSERKSMDLPNKGTEAQILLDW